MKRPRLLYVSPFAPMKSGISDYSELLVYGLRDHFDVTLLTDNYKLANPRLVLDFTVLRYKKGFDCSGFDHVVYNIGNNPFFHAYIYELALRQPGLVILHDIVLYYLVVGYYREREDLYAKVYELEGPRGIHLLKRCVRRQPDLLECKELAPLLPLNGEVLATAKGIVVHSEFARNLVLQGNPGARVFRMNMVNMGHSTRTVDRSLVQRKYGIADDAFVIASFGYIAPTKLNHLVCEAVKELSRTLNRDLYYLMVGEGGYVDHELGRNIIKTGYVPQEDYDAILDRCDIVANLRYPSMGETSISLIHAMGMGKPCLVTDHAWFAELPDDVVVKTSPDQIEQELLQKLGDLLAEPAMRSDIGARARNYVENFHTTQSIALDIVRILKTEA